MDATKKGPEPLRLRDPSRCASRGKCYEPQWIRQSCHYLGNSSGKAHKAYPGECTKCARWLGSEEPPSLEQTLNDELLNWQEWVVSTLKELRSTSVSSGVFPWKAFFASLAKGMERQKGYSQLAQLAGI